MKARVSGSVRNDLPLHLLEGRNGAGALVPTHRKARHPRRARKRLSPNSTDVSFLFWPDDVAHRRQFSHWEADLMLFQTETRADKCHLIGRARQPLHGAAEEPEQRTKPVIGKIMKAVR